MNNNTPQLHSGSLAGELQRQLTLHRTEFLMFAALIFLALLLSVMLPEYLFLNLHVEEWNSPRAISSYNTPKITLVSALNIFFLTICVGASLMFSDLSTKEKRIATLSYPVSSRVSFFARAIRCVILPALVCIIGFILLDLARVVIFTIITIGHETHFTTVWPHLAENTETIRKFFIYVAVYPTFIFSIFMFGSIFWPKFSFPKTFCLLLGLFLTGIILLAITKSLIDNKLSTPVDEWWFITMMWILSFVNLLLTYLRLKETDI